MEGNYLKCKNIVACVCFFIATKQFYSHSFSRQKGANPTARSNSKAISERLRKMLNKIMIKRNKEDVFPDDQIPEKNEQAILCDLSPLQKEVYMHVLKVENMYHVL